MFLVVVENKILQKINTVSKLLPLVDVDLSKAANLFGNATEELRKFRGQFEMAKYEAETLALNIRGNSNKKSEKAL